MKNNVVSFFLGTMYVCMYLIPHFKFAVQQLTNDYHGSLTLTAMHLLAVKAK